MRFAPSASKASERRRGTAASVLVIVLWITLGLVTITLYFANSMTFELRASDNRVSALAADQAIEGAAQYVSTVLANYSTNGVVPEVKAYACEAVPVGEARFWLIGRPVDYTVQPDQVYFGLVDEASKLNLNTASETMLATLTNMTLELAANIVDWRSTNGAASTNGDGPEVYSQYEPGYLCKMSSFETVDELRLVFRTDMGLLYGEDLNLNGALDPSEMDTNRNNVVDSGILEYLTVYTREPNTTTNGTAKINVGTVSSTGSSELLTLLQTNLTSTRYGQVVAALGIGGGGPSPGGQSGGPRGPARPVTLTFRSLLQFYSASGMTMEEFGAIADSITVNTNEFTYGRVNVNTASPYALMCLPGMSFDLAQVLTSYRRQNPNNLTSIAWVVEALGQNNVSALTALAASDCITTRSYQYSADIAALGPYGRGYRRVKFIFDISSGTPEIVYRQDLSHLGWALGRYVRDTWLLAKDAR
jgi:DNA uptake protein ComE-like DNA-binding protein